MNRSLTYFLFSPSRRAWKIGRTRHISVRFETHRRKCRDIELRAVFMESEWSEKERHQEFVAFSLGREWFSDDEKIQGALQANTKLNILPLPMRDHSELRAFAKASRLENRRRAISVNVPLTGPERRALERIAKAEQRSLAAQIRHFISPYLGLQSPK